MMTYRRTITVIYIPWAGNTGSGRKFIGRIINADIALMRLLHTQGKPIAETVTVDTIIEMVARMLSLHIKNGDSYVFCMNMLCCRNWRLLKSRL
jgi:hypothetical protein